MPEPDASKIRSLRRGALSESDALAWARRLQEELAQAAANSTLPDAIDTGALETFLTRFYQRRYDLDPDSR